MSTNLVHLTASLSSAGFHPAGWRLGHAAASPIGRHYQAMAHAAERAGLDAVWLGQDDVMPIDALPLLGSLIAVTQSIGLGGRWRIEHAEPFHVARVFATLDHLASGRTALLVGLPGEGPGAAQFGHVAPLPQEEALQRAGELLDVARQLWDSWEDEGLLLDVGSGRFADPEHVHPIEHKGRYFTVRGPLNVPRPPQGNPVIAFEVADDAAARQLALREGDVLLLSATSKEQAGGVRLRARASQRVLVDVMPILGATDREAAARAEALDAMAVRPRAMRFVGTAAGLRDLCADWVGAGVCDGFNLRPAVLPDDLEAILAAVAPLARRSPASGTLRERLGLARPRSRFSR